MRSFIDDGYIYVSLPCSDYYEVSKTIEGDDTYKIYPNDTNYSFLEAENYWNDNPDKRYGKTPYQPTPQELIQEEVAELKKYLSDTDWAVTKCYDRGLVFADEYPDLYVTRQQARDRINELENN